MRWVNLHSGVMQFEVMIQVTYVAIVMHVLVFVYVLQLIPHAVCLECGMRTFVVRRCSKAFDVYLG